MFRWKCGVTRKYKIIRNEYIREAVGVAINSSKASDIDIQMI